MYNDKRGPTHDENKKHRENNLRCLRFTLNISLRFFAVAPSLDLLLVETDLQKNSQIAVEHHQQRGQETGDYHQQNVAAALAEGNFAHGVQRAMCVLVPTKDWENTNDNGPGPYYGQ